MNAYYSTNLFTIDLLENYIDTFFTFLFIHTVNNSVKVMFDRSDFYVRVQIRFIGHSK